MKLSIIVYHTRLFLIESSLVKSSSSQALRPGVPGVPGMAMQQAGLQGASFYVCLILLLYITLYHHDSPCMQHQGLLGHHASMSDDIRPFNRMRPTEPMLCCCAGRYAAWTLRSADVHATAIPAYTAWGDASGCLRGRGRSQICSAM